MTILEFYLLQILFAIGTAFYHERCWQTEQIADATWNACVHPGKQ